MEMEMLHKQVVSGPVQSIGCHSLYSPLDFYAALPWHQFRESKSCKTHMDRPGHSHLFGYLIAD